MTDKTGEPAGPAQQHGFGFLVHGHFFKYLTQGQFKDGIHDGKQAQQEQVGLAVLDPDREQFTETGTHQGRQDRLARPFLARALRYHRTHFALAQHGERMPHRMNFIGETENRGVQTVWAALCRRRSSGRPHSIYRPNAGETLLPS